MSIPMTTPGVLFVLESFRRHMDDGRILFQRGMEQAGYVSAGGGCPSPEIDSTDVRRVVEAEQPQVVVFWPRYEWCVKEWGGTEVTAEHEFHDWEFLRDRPDILRVTVFHDAGSARKVQKQWHDEFDPHIFLTWYHPLSVAAVASHVPLEKMVRIYHLVDRDAVPEFADRNGTCLLSGAAGGCYPLRTKAFQWAEGGLLGSGVTTLCHPGYGQIGTRSPAYMQELARHRVALATASSYGFALRKIFEATAAGCRVITDLPEYDDLPGIDGNLIRVRPDISAADLAQTIQDAAAGWDYDQQHEYAKAAIEQFDWRAECRRVAWVLRSRRRTMCSTA